MFFFLYFAFVQVTISRVKVHFLLWYQDSGISSSEVMGVVCMCLQDSCLCGSRSNEKERVMFLLEETFVNYCCICLVVYIILAKT